MKFYQKRGFALVVLILAIIGSGVYGISKKPAALLKPVNRLNITRRNVNTAVQQRSVNIGNEQFSCKRQSHEKTLSV